VVNSNTVVWWYPKGWRNKDERASQKLMVPQPVSRVTSSLTLLQILPSLIYYYHHHHHHHHHFPHQHHCYSQWRNTNGFFLSTMNAVSISSKNLDKANSITQKPTSLRVNNTMRRRRRGVHHFIIHPS